LGHNLSKEITLEGDGPQPLWIFSQFGSRWIQNPTINPRWIGRLVPLPTTIMTSMSNSLNNFHKQITYIIKVTIVSVGVILPPHLVVFTPNMK